jgi:hypothetical protein
LEAIQRIEARFCFAKTIMYLANIPELDVRVERAWEIAVKDTAGAGFGGACAAGMQRTMRNFVGERG